MGCCARARAHNAAAVRVAGPTPPAPPPACGAVESNMGVAGETRVLATLPNLTAADCCAACLKTFACDSWSRVPGKSFFRSPSLHRAVVLVDLGYAF